MVVFFQQNAQKSELAHVELFRRISNISEDSQYIAFIQEPHRNRNKIGTVPVHAEYFPKIPYTNQRAAIFSSSSLKLKELPQLSNGDCIVCSASLEGQTVLLASVYMDICYKVRQ